MKNYKEKLKDPLWQRMRLMVFERDDFKCLRCGDDENELHAHHTYYEKGKNPWNYPIESIVTLCKKCHEQEHIKIKILPCKGIVKCDKVIEQFPELKKYFSAIRNQKGKWDFLINLNLHPGTFTIEHTNEIIELFRNIRHEIAPFDDHFNAILPSDFSIIECDFGLNIIKIAK
jgi:hypothetical protein